MKNKFITQAISAIQRFGLLIISAFCFICFASAGILDNAQTTNPIPDSAEPIFPMSSNVKTAIWGIIFVGSILVLLVSSPIVKGRATTGAEEKL